VERSSTASCRERNSGALAPPDGRGRLSPRNCWSEIRHTDRRLLDWKSRMDKSSCTRLWNANSLLIVGLGSGIFAGLIEGVGLLFFQRLNWARWGPMIPVSGEIPWISPIVDVILFLSLALICSAGARFVPRLPTIRELAILVTFSSFYAWLTLTR